MINEIFLRFTLNVPYVYLLDTNITKLTRKNERHGYASIVYFFNYICYGWNYEMHHPCSKVSKCKGSIVSKVQNKQCKQRYAGLLCVRSQNTHQIFSQQIQLIERHATCYIPRDGQKQVCIINRLKLSNHWNVHCISSLCGRHHVTLYSTDFGNFTMERIRYVLTLENIVRSLSPAVPGYVWGNMHSEPYTSQYQSAKTEEGIRFWGENYEKCLSYFS